MVSSLIALHILNQGKNSDYVLVQDLSTKWVVSPYQLSLRKKRPIVLPLEAGLRLVLAHPSRAPKEIRELPNLAGAVRIESQVDALQFVRLATGPKTFAAFSGSHIIEVLLRESLSKEFVWGDNELLRELMAVENGTYGILDRASFKEAAFFTPVITLKDSEYTISRCVATVDRDAVAFWRLVERVTLRGGYKVVLKREFRPKKLVRIHWPLAE